MWLINRLKFIQGDDSLNLLLKQQQIILCVVTAFAIVGATGALLGLYGYQTTIFHILLAGYDAVFVTIFLLYLYGRVSITTALSVDLLFAAWETVAENIVVVDNNDLYSRFLLFCNVSLLMLIIMVCVLAYMPKTALLIGAMTIGIYIFNISKARDGILVELSGFYFLMLVSLAVIGWFISRAMEKLRLDNIDMHDKEYQLISTLGLDTSQILRIVQLTNRHDESADKEMKTLTGLLDSMSSDARERMMSSLQNYMLSKQTEKDRLQRLLPVLSPSEIDICKLIIEGKTTGEICRLLDKKKGNVGSQRAHIRIKLGLQPEENLKEALMNIVNNE